MSGRILAKSLVPEPGVAGGWRVRKCHVRGLKYLRAVKIFPLARLACRQPGEAHLDVGLID